MVQKTNVANFEGGLAMGLHHGHSHDHGHNHGKGANKKALLTSLIITTTFLIIEVIGGFLTNSLALLSDAGHMLSDSSALFLSLIAMYFAARPPSAARTYGLFRFEILAALINGVTLVLISVYIFWEAIERLTAPPEVSSLSMMGIAFIGLLANIASAFVLMRGDYKNNLNMRSAFLHVLGDMLGSVGAIVAGLLMWMFGWYIADPIISIVVGVLIIISAWRVTKDSIHVLMEGTPSSINVHEVEASLGRIAGVTGVHDLHIWTVTSGFDALTVHLQVEDELPSYPVLQEALHLLRDQYGITHATVQIENSAVRHDELLCQVGPGHDHHEKHHDHDHNHAHAHE